MISVPDTAIRRPTLLVVDDDAEIRMSVSTLFGDLGYEVTSAKDAADALEQMARRAADVVLTEIYMHGQDGFELINALRQHYRATLVAAMSGDHDEYNPLPFASKLGADLVISKPFHPAQLVEAIDRLIRCYRRLPG